MRDVNMFTKSTIPLIGAVILGAVSASAAKDLPGVPKTDLQKFCKETSSALATNLSTQGDVDVCMSDEQAARDQLVKDWATYPALTKTTCVQPNEYLPSYIEWLTCIEMTRDVLKMRKETAASTPESPNGSYPAGRQCPIVKIGVDGSIKWVIAC